MEAVGNSWIPNSFFVRDKIWIGKELNVKGNIVLQKCMKIIIFLR